MLMNIFRLQAIAKNTQVSQKNIKYAVEYLKLLFNENILY